MSVCLRVLTFYSPFHCLFAGPLSLGDHVFDTCDVAEELVAYNKVSEGILDMSEDDRVVMHILPEIFKVEAWNFIFLTLVGG
jgi:hypothetical protein